MTHDNAVGKFKAEHRNQIKQNSLSQFMVDTWKFWQENGNDMELEEMRGFCSSVCEMFEMASSEKIPYGKICS